MRPNYELGGGGSSSGSAGGSNLPIGAGCDYFGTVAPERIFIC